MLKRYGKEARALAELHKAPQAVVEYGSRIEARLASIVEAGAPPGKLGRQVGGGGRQPRRDAPPRRQSYRDGLAAGLKEAVRVARQRKEIEQQRRLEISLLTSTQS